MQKSGAGAVISGGSTGGGRGRLIVGWVDGWMDPWLGEGEGHKRDEQMRGGDPCAWI